MVACLYCSLWVTFLVALGQDTHSLMLIEYILYATHGAVDMNKTNYAPVSIKLIFYWWRYKIST